MRLLYSNAATIARGGTIQLLRLENNLYVVGPGFLFSVDGKEEGTQLIRKLEDARASGERILDRLGNTN